MANAIELRDPYDYPFVAVPRSLVEEGDADTIALYVCLKFFAQGKTVAFPGQKRLAEMMGKSLRHTRDVLTRLEELGYVDVERRKLEGLPNSYTLRPHGKQGVPGGSAHDAPGSAPDAGGSAHSAYLGKHTVPPKETKSKEKKEGEVNPVGAAKREIRTAIVDCFYAGKAYNQAGLTKLVEDYYAMGATGEHVRKRHARAVALGGKPPFLTPWSLHKNWDMYSEEAVNNARGGRNPSSFDQSKYTQDRV